MDKDYKKLCEEYERRMGIGEHDPAKDGYLVYVNILKQQIQFLNTYKILGNINSDDKSKIIEYKNAKDLWEGLPSMIKSVGQLKVELKIEGEKREDEYIPLSVKSVANGTTNV